MALSAAPSNLNYVVRKIRCNLVTKYHHSQDLSITMGAASGSLFVRGQLIGMAPSEDGIECTKKALSPWFSGSEWKKEGCEQRSFISCEASGCRPHCSYLLHFGCPPLWSLSYCWRPSAISLVPPVVQNRICNQS